MQHGLANYEKTGEDMARERKLRKILYLRKAIVTLNSEIENIEDSIADMTSRGMTTMEGNKALLKQNAQNKQEIKEYEKDI